MESKTCSNCGGIMKHGSLGSPGEMAVLWRGERTGILSSEPSRVSALRCPECGLIQLWSEPDNPASKQPIS